MGSRNRNRGGAPSPSTEPVAAPGPAEDVASSAPLASLQPEADEAAGLEVDPGSEVSGTLETTADPGPIRMVGEDFGDQPILMAADFAPGELQAASHEGLLPPAQVSPGPRRYRVVGPGSVIVRGSLRGPGWEGEMSEADAVSLGACVEEV